jgi:hypothetical protein
VIPLDGDLQRKTFPIEQNTMPHRSLLFLVTYYESGLESYQNCKKMGKDDALQLTALYNGGWFAAKFLEMITRVRILFIFLSPF